MGIVILLVYIVVVVAVFYLLMVRPQRRRRAAQRELLAAVKKGDEIVTLDGMIGTVRQVRDRFLIVEVAERKQVRLLKSAIAQVRS